VKSAAQRALRRAAGRCTSAGREKLHVPLRCGTCGGCISAKYDVGSESSTIYIYQCICHKCIVLYEIHIMYTYMFRRCYPKEPNKTVDLISNLGTYRFPPVISSGWDDAMAVGDNLLIFIRRSRFNAARR